MPERDKLSKLIEVTELFELHETPANLHLELLEVQLLKKEVVLVGISREALRERRMECSGSVSVMDSCVGREDMMKRKKKRAHVAMFSFFYFFSLTSSGEGFRFFISFWF